MNVEHSFLSDTVAAARPSVLSRWMKKRRWFIIFVIAPTMLAALYFGLFASDIYVSESRFVIKSPDQKRAQLSSLANLIQTTGLSGGQEQANEVLDFVRSRDALKALEKTPGFRARYASHDVDFLSRFPQPLHDNTFEDLYKYYGKQVEAQLDTETGASVIRVKGYTAQDAYEVNRRLLELSEDLVNRLNDRVRTRAISEAQRQVDLATDRARTARIALARYRNSEELIDPAKQAVGVLEISNGLIAQRAALQAQLDQMRRVTPENPSIPALQNRVNAISGQIGAQDNRVVGSPSGIASKLGGYENLLVEQEFATQNLNVANAALVQARADAQRQQYYLERVVEPNLPDMPLLPRRLLDIIIVAAVATCLYFIGWMLVVGILEHAPEE
ncbi:capsule biosynthesis protein [Novosphingobium sp. BL-8A]|uniref:capsule biosynthesis protein n=1 Tax=Novosphingobium sp. BL-8A TaxID=3127639 RepID=UPI003756C11B